jgi:hypothetical protein
MITVKFQVLNHSHYHKNRKGQHYSPRPINQNPDDLLPELPRDPKGRIQTSDNIKKRPEKYSMKPDGGYYPRHQKWVRGRHVGY